MKGDSFGAVSTRLLVKYVGCVKAQSVQVSLPASSSPHISNCKLGSLTKAGASIINNLPKLERLTEKLKQLYKGGCSR